MTVRVLWASPLPPVRSGVSDYAMELLPHLAESCRVRVVLPPGGAATVRVAVERNREAPAECVLEFGSGAAACGMNVSMFFTFWGLNILRKSSPAKVKKTLIEKMFGFMMPRGPRKLTLSKMHMAGMGTAMIKRIMKKKNVSSLEELIQSAIDNGVTIEACQMSMDLMGIKKEELIVSPKRCYWEPK